MIENSANLAQSTARNAKEKVKTIAQNALTDIIYQSMLVLNAAVNVQHAMNRDGA